MGRFQIHREVVLPKTLAGHGSDGRDDHPVQRLTELVNPDSVFQDLNHVIDLDGIRDQQHIDVVLPHGGSQSL